jgi:hypothetical protein
MTNPLSGCRVKIDRAKKHLADLKAAVDAFDALHPYGVVVDKKTDPDSEIHRFWLNVPIPDEWAGILGDCVHNLRSSLDLLAIALIEHNGGTPGDYSAFPISPNETHFDASGVTRLKGASAQAVELVRSLKPYRGDANNTLWELHRLDIADKHQLLIPVAAAHKILGIKFDIRGPGMEDIPQRPMEWGEPHNRSFPLKNGDILGRYIPFRTAGYEDKSEFEFGFEIAFGEGQVFDGEPLIPTLVKLVDFTEGAIDIFARNIFGLASW